MVKLKKEQHSNYDKTQIVTTFKWWKLKLWQTQIVKDSICDKTQTASNIEIKTKNSNGYTFWQNSYRGKLKLWQNLNYIVTINCENL